jgi:hypothetical protein
LQTARTGSVLDDDGTQIFECALWSWHRGADGESSFAFELRLGGGKTLSLQFDCG